MTLSRLSPFGLGTAAVLLVASHNAFPVPPIPDDYHVGGFAVGCQAWTFKSFTVLETIEKTAQAGGKVIEFFPGQKLSKEEPTARFDHNASDETIRHVKDHLARNKVLAVNYGVVGAKGDAEWRKIFEFAKKLGLYGITTEAVGNLDTIEKLVKEFDIAVGIHQHPKRPNDPNYKVWDPAYVLAVVKDRDPRIGACADTGHWATSGVNPLDAIKLLRGRIISLHLKERDKIGQHGTDLIFGTGITDTKAILDELKRQGFQGNISIEYETNWENSVPDVAQCVGFIRGLGRCPK